MIKTKKNRKQRTTTTTVHAHNLCIMKQLIRNAHLMGYICAKRFMTHHFDIKFTRQVDNLDLYLLIYEVFLFIFVVFESILEAEQCFCVVGDPFEKR